MLGLTRGFAQNLEWVRIFFPELPFPLFPTYFPLSPSDFASKELTILATVPPLGF